MKRLVAVIALGSVVWPGNTRAAPAETWYPVESPTKVELNDVSFAPDGAGFAVGQDSTVLRYDGYVWHTNTTAGRRGVGRSEYFRRILPAMAAPISSSRTRGAAETRFTKKQTMVFSRTRRKNRVFRMIRIWPWAWPQEMSIMMALSTRSCLPLSILDLRDCTIMTDTAISTI